MVTAELFPAIWDIRDKLDDHHGQFHVDTPTFGVDHASRIASLSHPRMRVFAFSHGLACLLSQS